MFLAFAFACVLCLRHLRATQYCVSHTVSIGTDVGIVGRKIHVLTKVEREEMETGK